MGNLLKETPHSETNATLEVLDRFGVTRSDLEGVRANNGEFGKLVAEFIKNGPQPAAAPTGKVSDLHKIVIRRDVPRDKRVAGMKIKDDYIDRHFTAQRFPLPTGEPIEREIGLLDMGRDFTLDEAKSEADKLGFELAETEDGVAYVTEHPDRQMSNLIIVGGSWARTSEGRDMVPVFHAGLGNHSERYLDLCSDVDGGLERGLSLDGHEARQWRQGDRVLVRRKSK